MKNIFFVFMLSLISGTLLSQDYSYKTKEYDLAIYNYLIAKTQVDSASFEEYLEYTKPFSKWDIRPLIKTKVWALDTIHSASTIPNFIWGSFSNKYGLNESQAMAKPNSFIKEGAYNKNENISFFRQHQKMFKKLTKEVVNSSNQLFLNQQNVQRIDTVYREGDDYWTYIIPEGSPFPISDTTQKLVNRKFSNKQEVILELLDELKVYSVFKVENGGVYFLIDGFTDNSYGFYFNPRGVMDTSHNLFQIMGYEEVNDKYFYYVAN